MRTAIRRARAKVRAALDRQAKVRDLVKASLPLWISVVIGSIVGGWAILRVADARELDQSCSVVVTLDHLYDRVELILSDPTVLEPLRQDLIDNYPDPDTC